MTQSTDIEEITIRGVKNDFYIRTGKYVKVENCSRWESTANFTLKATVGQVINMVLDCTRWTWKDTFMPGPTRVRGRQMSERLYRRGLIDYLAANNGNTIVSIARFTDRDHTTVINSINKFEERLETEGYVRKAFMEVADFCRANFYLYKRKDWTKEELIAGEEDTI